MPQDYQRAAPQRAEPAGGPAAGAGEVRAGEPQERAQVGRLSTSRPRRRSARSGSPRSSRGPASSSARWTRCSRTRRRCGEQSAQLAAAAGEGRGDGARTSARSCSQLFPPPGSQLEPGRTARSSSSSAEQQRQLEQRAQELQQQMRRDGADGAAVRRGGRASRWSRSPSAWARPPSAWKARTRSRGYGEQQAALEGLKQLPAADAAEPGRRREGRRCRCRCSRGGRQQGGNGISRRRSRSRTRTPTRRPEFRKDLLDAMKQGAPDRYSEQVKRYYEELVK